MKYRGEKVEEMKDEFNSDWVNNKYVDVPNPKYDASIGEAVKMWEVLLGSVSDEVIQELVGTGVTAVITPTGIKTDDYDCGY